MSNYTEQLEKELIQTAKEFVTPELMASIEKMVKANEGRKTPTVIENLFWHNAANSLVYDVQKGKFTKIKYSFGTGEASFVFGDVGFFDSSDVEQKEIDVTGIDFEISDALSSISGDENKD